MATKRNPDIKFHHKDICSWSPPKKYDFITAWDSIWHIPLIEQEHVLTKLVALLNQRGILIFSFGGTDQASEHTDDFMGPEVYYATLGVSGFIHLCGRLGCIIRHLEYDQHPELHTYLIIQRAE